MKILWAICVIPLIIGILMMECATTKSEYPTSEYWVAKDYHHVYEKYSGEIVDYISENESCSIDGNTITVTTRKEGLLVAGAMVTALFGMFTIGLIWGTISTSEWWNRIKNQFENNL